jgi:hypothetical protein
VGSRCAAHHKKDDWYGNSARDPLVYIPIHETDATPIGSSLRFKNAYLKAVVAANVPVQPEIRWMVDPDDFVRPMIYDPKDDRWKKSNNQQTINKFCNH